MDNTEKPTKQDTQDEDKQNKNTRWKQTKQKHNTTQYTLKTAMRK